MCVLLEEKYFVLLLHSDDCVVPVICFNIRELSQMQGLFSSYSKRLLNLPYNVELISIGIFLLD